MNKIWPELYRPKSIKDVIFSSPAEREMFERYVAKRQIPNMLLVGAPGTGKTSVSQSLINDLKVDPSDVLKVDCSKDQIDEIRGKVASFAYTMPMGDFKVVRLEEMDYLSQPAQALLRTLIEEVESSCRFIGTANYANKILPPVYERLPAVTFNAPNKDEVIVRCADILEKEGIKYDVDDLLLVVDAGYPSVRRIISMLEQQSGSGTLVLRSTESVTDWKLQLLPLLEAGDFQGARKVVCEVSSREELQDVYRFLYTNIHRVKKIAAKQDEAIVLIARYQFQASIVQLADMELQLAAMFIELGAL
jgi:DNA polymerase III delta prime subunit